MLFLWGLWSNALVTSQKYPANKQFSMLAQEFWKKKFYIIYFKMKLKNFVVCFQNEAGKYRYAVSALQAPTFNMFLC